mgnify:CR=1 FL=1
MIDYESFDDAAAYSLNKETILQTVDFFTPIVDDPYDFGRIAAANSLSDIYAMGGKPLFALNIVAFPTDDLPLDVLSEILRGGADIASEAGISILGGHSIKDKEPKYGLVVTGTPHSIPINNSTSKPGDILILTKPLGLGVISTAIKKGIASEEMVHKAVETMVTLNKNASEVMMEIGVNACTDVTGYGLLGHLLEMCKGANLTANINFHELDFIEGSIKLAKDGIVPGGTKRNHDYFKNYIQFSDSIELFQKYLLTDAQTSGGLLISVSEENFQDLNSKLIEAKCNPLKIGFFEPAKSDNFIKVS